MHTAPRVCRLIPQVLPHHRVSPAPVHCFGSYRLRNSSSLRMATPAPSRIWETAAWKALAAHAEKNKDVHLRDLLKDAERCAFLSCEFDGILLDFARQRLSVDTLSLLLELASTAQLKSKIAAMASGAHINVTEDRSVLHMALRAPAGTPHIVDGVDVNAEVHAVLSRIADFTSRVRRGDLKGVTGKTLTDVVSIGIGGSYLGVEFVYEALRKESTAGGAADGRRLRFLANVDPVDVSRALEGLNAETTLVIVISKTFTTAETMLNARSLRSWLVRSLTPTGASEAAIVAAHMAAVSTNLKATTAFGIAPEAVFGFWDWVGGRYSVTSAVGMLPLSLHFGYDVMRHFLDGAHAVDVHFTSAPFAHNIPVLMGLLGVYNSSFLGYPARALLPYSQALLRFAAHIQQVDMESNGKRVTVDGEVLPFAAGEVDFGEPGTNGQHSFYQLLHQGRVVPADFIGVCESQEPIQLPGEPVSNHDELMSNFFAQPDALAMGKTPEEVAAEGAKPALVPHKVFDGNRPSLSLLLPRLNAYTAGQLLAIYEHRTAVQGFIWNVPSFDQWGVELGKVLAKQVREQLHASRGAAAAGDAAAATVAGFNPSTTKLMTRYLKHVDPRY